MSTSLVDCAKLGLVTVPSDIPSTTVRFDIAFNNIRNVTYLPPLPKLYTLDMSYNSIESVSWMSLRTLPALAILELQGNQLKYVKLDIVIAHLPKLKSVNLSMNKLASFSAYALGWPQLTDCGTTHQAETKLQSTESVTFLTNGSIKNNIQSPFVTKEPSLARMPTKASPTSASTAAKSMGLKEENNIKYIAIFLIETCLTVCLIACLVRLMRKNMCREDTNIAHHSIHSHQIVPPIGNILYNETVAEGSNSRQPGAHQPPIQLDQIVPPIANISYNETVAGGSNPRQPIAHQITSPIVNSSHQCTSTGGLDGGHLGTSGENQNTPSVENYENYSTEGQEHLYENDDDDGKHENHPAEGLNYEHLRHNNDDIKYSTQLEATMTSKTHSVGGLYHETVAASQNTERYSEHVVPRNVTSTLYTDQ
ncbi:hypothetical protein Bbelb_258720 [Branchiostoma belcheri]|nr:hypothetical protein Bbelb_258720 [Branchiostoma belcheri]